MVLDMHAKLDMSAWWQGMLTLIYVNNADHDTTWKKVLFDETFAQILCLGKGMQEHVLLRSLQVSPPTEEFFNGLDDDRLQAAFQHIGMKVAEIDRALGPGNIREATPKRVPTADVYETFVDDSVWPSSIEDKIMEHITRHKDQDVEMPKESEALMEQFFAYGGDILFGFLGKFETQRCTAESLATGELLRDLCRRKEFGPELQLESTT